MIILIKYTLHQLEYGDIKKINNDTTTPTTTQRPPAQAQNGKISNHTTAEPGTGPME
jgi:hypothetical protein